MWAAAKTSYTAQKSIANHLQMPASLLIPICFNICRACMEEGSCKVAEQHARYALGMVEAGDAGLQIRARQMIVEAIKGASNYVRTCME